MTMFPRRVQRRRAKGWKMPANTVYVGRPTKWGNPWTIEGYYDAGYSGTLEVAREACIEEYRAWLTRTRSAWSGYVPDTHVRYLNGVLVPKDVSMIRASLRGKNLACWCPLDQPCHADVLLQLANGGDEAHHVPEGPASTTKATQEL